MLFQSWVCGKRDRDNKLYPSNIVVNDQPRDAAEGSNPHKSIEATVYTAHAAGADWRQREDVTAGHGWLSGAHLDVIEPS